MKKIIMALAVVFTFSTATLSCRDTRSSDDQVDNVENDLDELGDDIEDGAEDVGDEFEQGARKIKEGAEEGAEEIEEEFDNNPNN